MPVNETPWSDGALSAGDDPDDVVVYHSPNTGKLVVSNNAGTMAPVPLDEYQAQTGTGSYTPSSGSADSGEDGGKGYVPYAVRRPRRTTQPGIPDIREDYQYSAENLWAMWQAVEAEWAELGNSYASLSRHADYNPVGEEVALVIATQGLPKNMTAEEFLNRFAKADPDWNIEDYEAALAVVKAAMSNQQSSNARITDFDSGGFGGGDGVGLTTNDFFSDVVQTQGILESITFNDIEAARRLYEIEEEYGVRIAFPINSSQADLMHRLPGDNILDPAKPALRIVTGADLETLAQIEQNLARLREFGVNLAIETSQETDPVTGAVTTVSSHWTPTEIGLVATAISDMGEAAHSRATALGLIDPAQVTSEQAFQAVYTREGSGLRFVRSDQNRGDRNTYAINSNGTITLYDAAFYGEQTSNTGIQRGVYFTPYLLIQHETAHQVNFIHRINGQDPATVYNNSFVYSEGRGFQYTFQERHTFFYVGDEVNAPDEVNDIRFGSVEPGDTLPVPMPNTDSGYEYRVRTTDPNSTSYNSAEEVTDAHIAETAGYGTYSSDGLGSLNEELYGLARQEVNQKIYDSILRQITWENLGD